MKKFIFIIFAISLVSCQQKQERIIETIQVLYYNGLFWSVVDVGCDEIVFDPMKIPVQEPEYTEDGYELPRDLCILDTIITDKKVLQEIASELKLVKKSKDYGVDARMKCFIKYTDGDIDSLCLTAPTTYGYFNEKPMLFTNKFAYLIRENCGFYKWMGCGQMEYFDELNDTTFVGEKVISISGEEY